MKPPPGARKESILYDIYHLGSQKMKGDGIDRRVRKGASVKQADKAHASGSGGMKRMGDTGGARRVKGA